MSIPHDLDSLGKIYSKCCIELKVGEFDSARRRHIAAVLLMSFSQTGNNETLLLKAVRESLFAGSYHFTRRHLDRAEPVPYH